jgi:prepilin-type processing-associated H-X9-DG protein
MRTQLSTTFFVLLAVGICVTGLRWARAHQTDPRESALATSCVSNCKQLAMGMLMYAQDYDEKLPPMKTSAKFQKAVMPYIKNAKIFLCPATQKPYALNATLNHKSMAKIKTLATTAAIFDAKPHADGMYSVAYVDGHVKREKKVPRTK